MRINAEWKQNGVGVLEPVLRCQVESGNGLWIEESFLVDSGAEQTVLSNGLLRNLDAPRHPSLNQLMGLGGAVACLTVSTRLKFRRDAGIDTIINGPFDGLSEGGEGEISILGRDVLGNFAVILDRPSRIVCLLHGRHNYSIHET